MDTKEMLRKLDEKFANGDVTEETYKEIKKRYEDESSGEGDGETCCGHGHGHGHGRGRGHGFGGYGGFGRVIREEREDGLYVCISGAEDFDGDLVAKDVVVSGSCDIGGNIEADNIKISGSCDVTGSVKAKEKFIASGSCDVGGDAEADVIEIRGACDIANNAKAREFKASGACEVVGNVTAESCTLSGACDIGGLLKALVAKSSGVCDINAVEADEFEGRGCFEIASVKAGKVEIRMAGKCKVGTIEADTVDARPRQANGHLVAGDIVVSKEAYLEKVRAKRVAGPKVEIGPGCEIDEVESKDLKVDPSSKVGKASKAAPPAKTDKAG